MSKTIAEHIYSLHEEGKTVSEIAELLNMERRDAHDLIVKSWADEKKRNKDSKSLLDW